MKYAILSFGVMYWGGSFLLTHQSEFGGGYDAGVAVGFGTSLLTVLIFETKAIKSLVQ